MAAMDMLPYLTDAGEVALASNLMRDHGDSAADEAAAMANRSRDLGNLVHFCRWRQVERLIHLLGDDRVAGTVH